MRADFRALVSLAVLTMLGFGMVQTVSTAEPATATTNNDAKLDEVNMKYAEATLALAEADLNKSLAANRRFANTYPAASLEYLHRSVDIARQRLEAIKNPNPKHRYEAFVTISEGGYRIAQADYEKAMSASKRVGASVLPEEMDRLRCTAEVAKLRYERALLADTQPAEVVLQWHIQEIADEVIRLRGRVEMLSRRD